MANAEVSVEARLVLPGAPAEELDRVTRNIRRELAEERVERVELVPGEPVAGAKSAEAVTLGALALVVLPSVLPKVVELLQEWTTRKQSLVVKLKLQHEKRSIELEVPLGQDAPERLRAFVEAAKQGLAD
ncbi:MAG TPA: hypothetical protein VNN80_21855 [Polyangiaceae bacterium]|jgi:hypothetical protein|nr:hypothetical protein [Polyangiaceae bacterium]